MGDGVRFLDFEKIKEPDPMILHDSLSIPRKNVLHRNAHSILDD